jgi:hypothetical protein
MCREEEENLVSSAEDLEAYNRARRAGRTWEEERRGQAERCEARRALEQEEVIADEVKDLGKADKKKKM